MAGPISHIVYAEKALGSFLTGKDKKQFMIGTLFPDIRALKVIDRHLTHFQNITVEEIQAEPDSFKAGMLFHSIIDEKREAFVLQHDAYANLPDSYLSTVALKLCEDIILYHKSQSWPTYSGYLQNIQPQELQFAIPTKKIEQWHSMHRDFFDNPPFDQNYQFFQLLGFNNEQVAEILSLAASIQESHTTDTYLLDFYDDLEHILTRYDK